MMKNRGAQSWEIGMVENTSGYTTNTRPGPAEKHKQTLKYHTDQEKDDTNYYANVNNTKVLAKKVNQIFHTVLRI